MYVVFILTATNKLVTIEIMLKMDFNFYVECRSTSFWWPFFSWSSSGSFISTGEKAVLIILLVFIVPMAIIRGLAVSCLLCIYCCTITATTGPLQLTLFYVTRLCDIGIWCRGVCTNKMCWFRISAAVSERIAYLHPVTCSKIVDKVKFDELLQSTGQTHTEQQVRGF